MGDVIDNKKCPVETKVKIYDLIRTYQIEGLYDVKVPSANNSRRDANSIQGEAHGNNDID